MRFAPQWISLVGVCLFIGVACTPPYTITPPPSFKRFEQSRDFRYITADGVMLKAREVDNYPRGELEFWTSALKLHLDERGYVFKSETCFKTEGALDGCTLIFLLPHGAEDWVFGETVYVVDDTIYLIEVAGPFERYAKVADELTQAYKTFDPHH